VIEIQQASATLFVTDPALPSLDPLVPIFHRWIQEHRLPGLLLIDVADYRHVHQGPGILLVAHQAHYAFGWVGSALGLSFHRKRDAAGPAFEKLREALGRCLEAARFLEDEPGFASKLGFRTDRVRLAVGSRLVASNRPEDRSALEGPVREVLGRVYGGSQVDLAFDPDPRAPLSLVAEAHAAPGLAEMAARLG
jgi:hypothetical protein